jgi:hypothetical protein
MLCMNEAARKENRRPRAENSILFILLLQIRPQDFDHSHTWQVTGDVEFQRGPQDGRPDPQP